MSGREPVRLDVWPALVVENPEGSEVGRLRDWRSLSVGELARLAQGQDALQDLVATIAPERSAGERSAVDPADLDRSMDAALAGLLELMDGAPDATRGWWRDLPQSTRRSLVLDWVATMHGDTGESSAPARPRPRRRGRK